MSRPLKFAGVAVITIATSYAYLGALDGGFVWDDEGLLESNETIAASNGLYQIWLTNTPQDYWPVTNTSFWLEWRLWGANPVGYHVTNLALHIAAALLLWAILTRISIPGAFLGALLFAVHPVNVESVAWISQRKNTLAMVFFLLSILGYLNFEAKLSKLKESILSLASSSALSFRTWYWYAASLIAFLLAMLSKGSVAVLPAVLLAICWWRRGRIGIPDLARVVPFAVLAASFTCVNIWFQTHGTGEVIRSAGLAERVAGAGAAVWFYLAKAVLPIDLIPIYPQWHIQSADLLWWIPLCAAFLATAILIWRDRSTHARMTRALLFAWACFCIGLAPVLGFADVGFMKFSLVADHYQYVAIIAVTGFAAASLTVSYNSAQGATRIAIRAATVALVVAFTFLAARQSQIYGSAGRFFEEAIEGNPDCAVAQYNLGVSLSRSGRYSEALERYRQALILKPDYAEAHNNLGTAYQKLGDMGGAIAHYKAALEIKPDFPEARYNLANNLLELGRLNEAIDQYREALKERSSFVKAQFHLAVALFRSGRLEDAIQQYELILAVRPDLAEAWENLAVAYAQLHRSADALSAGQKAIDAAGATGQRAQMEEFDRWLKTYREELSKMRPGPGPDE
jgi:protein O-mannosyl-transferase